MSHTITLPNSGAVVPSTGAPDYGNGAGDFALLCLALGKLDGVRGNVQHVTAAGAINITNGKVFLNTGAASAISLAAPVAGAPGAGGNDGQSLTIIAVDAFAYVLTTPTNKINGADDTATWTAAAGNNITLTAYNGVWYVEGTPKGVALTEV